MLIGASFLALQGCVAIPEFYGDGLAARKNGASTENEWNSKGVWYRVEGNPPTYLPVGYPSNLPRNEKDGIWVFDERKSSEKRIFVPYSGAGRGYSFGVLKGEATSVCRWAKRRIEWEPHPDITDAYEHLFGTD